jgi:hypothetical protein
LEPSRLKLMKELAILNFGKKAKYKGWSFNIRSSIQGQVEADSIPTSIELGSGSIPSNMRTQKLDTTPVSKREQTLYQDPCKQHLYEMYIEIIHKRFP